MNSFFIYFFFACVFFKGDPSFVDEIRRNGEWILNQILHWISSSVACVRRDRDSHGHARCTTSRQIANQESQETIAKAVKDVVLKG